jgi:serine/threonine-protein kinase
MIAPKAPGSAPDPRIGKVFGGRYVLTALCGSGSMGSVYEGMHEGLGRKVAVKCLHRHLATSAMFVERFTQEARLLSRLAHPNVVRVHDFGTEQTPNGPEVYLIMEFCSGRQLGDLLTQGARFPLSRIRAIMGQVLAALSELHAHGIVHRDIKPENVVLEVSPRGTEVVKLIDFGIAELKAVEQQRRGTIAGTPGYLSPEVICGGPVDHMADLYAAGCLLFELVTGHPLFEAESVPNLLALQVDAPRPDPRDVAPDRPISDALAAVCLRAVAIDPAERFADADAFAQALADAVAAPSGVSYGPPASTRSPKTAESQGPRPPFRSAPQIRSSLPVPGARYSFVAQSGRGDRPPRDGSSEA